MAITTYSELVSAVSDWADRGDLLDRIPDFITLAEIGFNQNMRVRQMEVSTTLTPATDGTVALPTDFLEWRRLTWTGTPRRDLQYVEPAYFEYKYPDRPSDTPYSFTIEGSTIKVGPVSTTGLDLLYVQKIPALTSGAPTNWLLTGYPNVYLWGALSQMAIYTKDQAALQTHLGALTSAVGAIQRTDTMMRAPSSMRVTVATP